MELIQNPLDAIYDFIVNTPNQKNTKIIINKFKDIYPKTLIRSIISDLKKYKNINYREFPTIINRTDIDFWENRIRKK